MLSKTLKLLEKVDLDISPKEQETKRKNRQTELHKNIKLCIKNKTKQNSRERKSSFSNGGNICKVLPLNDIKN
jgi:hypothetical protein